MQKYYIILKHVKTETQKDEYIFVFIFSGKETEAENKIWFLDS